MKRLLVLLVLLGAIAASLAAPASASASPYCGKYRAYYRTAHLVVKGVWRGGLVWHRYETFNSVQEFFCHRTARMEPYQRPGSTWGPDGYPGHPWATSEVHCWDVTGTYPMPCKPGMYGMFVARLTTRWVNRYQDKCVLKITVASEAWWQNIPVKHVTEACSFQSRGLAAA